MRATLRYRQERRLPHPTARCSHRDVTQRPESPLAAKNARPQQHHVNGGLLTPAINDLQKGDFETHPAATGRNMHEF